MGQRNEAEVGGDTGNITLSERRSYANYRIESGSPTVVMIWAIHTTWGVHLAELGPGWVIDDNRPSVGESSDRMTDIARYYRNQGCSGDLGHAVNGHLKLPLDHLVDLFLSMKVLVNGGTLLEIVMRERHISRVEIASIPTWQSLNDRQIACIHKGHGEFLWHIVTT